MQIIVTGLAYAMLAQVDAISGIYTAFFPVFFYILLGTSRHISMGTFDILHHFEAETQTKKIIFLKVHLLWLASWFPNLSWKTVNPIILIR
jgi:MFS superfamily sulfate permease-like transporter